MSKTTWIRSAIATSLTTAIFMTSSMAALAMPGNQPLMAELTVNGLAIDGDAPFVSVNGERATTGRTVFSSTTLTTPATSSATINLGKLGRIELAPNSSLNLDFNENGITGALNSGRVKASGTNISIQTKDGVVVSDQTQTSAFSVNLDSGLTKVSTEAGLATLNAAGKTVNVGAGQTGTSGQDTDDNDGDVIPGSTAVYAIVIGAAAAVLIWTASKGNDIELGGTSSVVSPVR